MTERLTVEIAGVRLPALRLLHAEQWAARVVRGEETEPAPDEWQWTAILPLGETGREASVQHFDPPFLSSWRAGRLHRGWELLWVARMRVDLETSSVVSYMEESEMLAQLQEWSR